jgi:hypothetical protein
MSIEDLSIGQLHRSIELTGSLSEAAMKHTLVVMSEENHECAALRWDEDDTFDDMPEFDDADVQIFLAYEDSVIAVCKMVRAGLRSHGFDMLSTEVGS